MRKLLFLGLLAVPLLCVQSCKALIDIERDDEGEDEEVYSLQTFKVEQQECKIEETIYRDLHHHRIENRLPTPIEVSREGEINLTYRVLFECEDYEHYRMLPSVEEGYYFEHDRSLLGVWGDNRWPFATGIHFKDNYFDVSKDYTVPPYSITEESRWIKKRTIEGKWSADYLHKPSVDIKTIEGTWNMVYESLEEIRITITPI